MTGRFVEMPPGVKARIAGGLWLITILAASFGLVAITGMIVRDDPATTAANILAGESLYRLAFLAEFVPGLCYLGVTVLMYQLLTPVSRSLSLLAAFFGLGGVAMGGPLFLSRLAPLVILHGGEFQVNTYTPGDQFGPEVEANSSGEFVVAWDGAGASPASAPTWTATASAPRRLRFAHLPGSPTARWRCIPEPSRSTTASTTSARVSPAGGLWTSWAGIRDSRIRPTHPKLTWTPQSGATLYHAARSASPAFPPGCILLTSGDPFLIDEAIPNSGGALYYIVRPAAPQVGSWGAGAFGERFPGC